MKIQVTQNDIDNGRSDNCKYCPVALAINRIFPGFVAVRSLTITVGEDKFPIGIPVWKFVRKFDTGCAVQPFEFELPEKL